MPAQGELGSAETELLSTWLIEGLKRRFIVFKTTATHQTVPETYPALLYDENSLSQHTETKGGKITMKKGGRRKEEGGRRREEGGWRLEVGGRRGILFVAKSQNKLKGR